MLPFFFVSSLYKYPPLSLSYPDEDEDNILHKAQEY